MLSFGVDFAVACWALLTAETFSFEYNYSAFLLGVCLCYWDDIMKRATDPKMKPETFAIFFTGAVCMGHMLSAMYSKDKGTRTAARVKLVSFVLGRLAVVTASWHERTQPTECVGE